MAEIFSGLKNEYGTRIAAGRLRGNALLNEKSGHKDVSAEIVFRFSTAQSINFFSLYIYAFQ